MRRYAVGLTLLGCLAGGCLSQRKPPYANDPLLLHYKPTLSDSATILAEKQARRGPVRPPLPPGASDRSAGESTIGLPQRPDPVRAQKDTAPEPPPPSKPAKEEATLLPPPPRDDSPPVAAGPEPAIEADPLPPPKTIVRAEELLPTAMAKFEAIAPSMTSTVPPRTEKPLSPPTAANVHVVAIAERPKLDSPQESTPAPAVSAQPTAVVTVPTEEIKPVSAESPGPAALPGKPRRSVDGDFGHDSDYHWLQGKLERHYRGYYCVRYRDPSEEDAHGGKVRLQDDPRVTAFADGDIIGLEGGVEAATGERGNPTYIVRDLWLVRKK